MLNKDSFKLDSLSVVYELSDRKKSENDSIQSEEGEKDYPLNQTKTADGKEVGKISEMHGLVYELAIEMKSMNESMTKKIDKLDKHSQKNIVQNRTQIMFSISKNELGEARNHLNTEMNTVNKRTDGLVSKINGVKEEVEKTTRPEVENNGKRVFIKMLPEKTNEVITAIKYQYIV